MSAAVKLVLNRFFSAVLLCTITICALKYADNAADFLSPYLMSMAVLAQSIARPIGLWFFFGLFIFSMRGMLYIAGSAYSLMKMALNFNRMDKALAIMSGFYDIENGIYRHNVAAAEKDIRKVSENIAVMSVMAYILYLLLN